MRFINCYDKRANSVDSNQMATFGVVWSGYTLFAQADLTTWGVSSLSFIFLFCSCPSHSSPLLSLLSRSNYLRSFFTFIPFPPFPLSLSFVSSTISSVCLLFPCPSLSSPLLSLLSVFSFSLGDDTKWPTRVDMSLNPNTNYLRSVKWVMSSRKVPLNMCRMCRFISSCACTKYHGAFVQSNFDGSNIFGTTENCSRHGWLEPWGLIIVLSQEANGDNLGIFLCSPKNFGGAYSRRFVRASVRPYVRVSVRPCVRPALVHANSRKLLVGFQWNFMGILSIKGGCAYHLRVLVRWFFQELLPFDEFCMNI